MSRNADSLSWYEACSREFIKYPEDDALAYLSLGLTNEAGEVAGKVKKVIRGDGELDRESVAQELGDVLFYFTHLARELGYTTEEIAMLNYAKLKDRNERGAIKGSGDSR